MPFKTKSSLILAFEALARAIVLRKRASGLGEIPYPQRHKHEKENNLKAVGMNSKRLGMNVLVCEDVVCEGQMTIPVRVQRDSRKIM